MRKMGRGRCVCETDTERAFCLLRRGDGGLQRGGRSAFFRPAVCMIFRGRTEEMIRVRDDDTTVVGLLQVLDIAWRLVLFFRLFFRPSLSTRCKQGFGYLYSVCC
jgi:hypothetical protein